MKKTGLYKKMLNIAVMPILLLGIVVTWLCYGRFTNTIFDQAREDMQNTAQAVEFAYSIAYPGDYYLVKNLDGAYNLYKGEADITTEYSIVDKFADDTASEISLLYKDMRVNTTFGRNNNSRMAGICTNAETASKVLSEGEEVFYKNVSIGSDKFLVLYIPMKNSDGEITGMIEVAKTVRAMNLAVMKAVWPVMLVAGIGMILAIFVSLKSTREITGVLKRLQIFMNKVAGGNLSAELETSVLRRGDELGDISKSATSMQKSIRAFVETDPLTQLGNRRYINNQLTKIMERAKETGQQFSLAICDIDFFKKVNDNYGHNAGDEVLKAVAEVLKTSMQTKGFVGRWGGEEFIVAFDKCGMYDAADYLWDVLGKIREMVVRTEGFEIKVTMTFGVVPGDIHKSIEEMVEGADAKLYYGKQNGRNQVVTDMEENVTEEEPEEVVPQISGQDRLRQLLGETENN